MRIQALVIVGVGLLATAAAGAEAARKEMKKLQGTWTIESLESEGKEIPKERLRGHQVTIKDDRWISSERGRVLSELKFQVNPSQTPKAIDFSHALGKEKGVVAPSRGIYELDGDTLKVAAGNERPTEFKTKAGSKSAVTVYRRAQP